MGKMNELSMLVDELKKCGETLVGLSEGLADLFSGSAEEKQPIKRVLLRRNPPRSQSRKHRRKRHSHWKMLEPCVQTNPAVVLRQRSKQS